jgi:hypothetical protein
MLTDTHLWQQNECKTDVMCEVGRERTVEHNYVEIYHMCCIVLYRQHVLTLSGGHYQAVEVQWKPLIMITLGRALFDNNNCLITLTF